MRDPTSSIWRLKVYVSLHSRKKVIERLNAVYGRPVRRTPGPDPVIEAMALEVLRRELWS